ncbi:hypothetical protein [Fuerstiella marisgermanici]|uniref:Uncharacterized protein n=1 Tax=Fuerstiella marisgermanici TaxID=1891926 RepID=A0A1P8WJP6_9PLAN|nr:hypothetical protein [Fuerstiella marisgermanici]APZ94273.1 hypothetical protein Fuma_03899 [Fuerstiella marisgermanici]
MILVPIFLMLFAAWMLWGWSVGESKNIKWLRQWCAPTFVVTSVILAAGAGAFLSRAITRQQVRGEVVKLLENVELRVRTGGADKVISEIQATDHSDDPDRDAFDILDHLTVMNKNLAPTSTEIAREPAGPQMH